MQHMPSTWKMLSSFHSFSCSATTPTKLSAGPPSPGTCSPAQYMMSFVSLYVSNKEDLVMAVVQSPSVNGKPTTQ